MVLDRKLQREVLLVLRECYPESVQISNIDITHDDENNYHANLTYLHEHDLIEAEIQKIIGVYHKVLTARITVHGLDFLEDDGGMSAILQTVTVKFDSDNVRKILEEKVIAANIPQEQKETALDKIKGASGSVLKDIITDMIKKGLDHPKLLAIFIDILSRF